MRKFTKKRVIVAFSALSLLFGAAAIAYLSTTGTGSGTGTVSSAGTATVTLSGSLGTSLSHIGDTATLTINGSNSGDSPAKVTDVKVTSIDTSSSTCPSGSFTAGAVDTSSGVQIPAATDADTPGTGKVGTATVTFNNVAFDQSTCAGTLTFHFGSAS